VWGESCLSALGASAQQSYNLLCQCCLQIAKKIGAAWEAARDSYFSGAAKAPVPAPSATAPARPHAASTSAAPAAPVTLESLSPALRKSVERMRALNGADLSQDDLLSEVLDAGLEYLRGVDKSQIFARPVSGVYLR
jgi:hypothetical protein